MFVLIIIFLKYIHSEAREVFACGTPLTEAVSEGGAVPSGLPEKTILISQTEGPVEKVTVH